MAKAFTMGNKPISFGVLLTRHGSFNSSITYDDPSGWPVGSTIALSFYEDPEDPDDAPITTWEGEITDAIAVWAQSVAEVTALILQNPQEARLIYTPSAGEPAVWAVAEIEVK